MKRFHPHILDLKRNSRVQNITDLLSTDFAKKRNIDKTCQNALEAFFSCQKDFKQTKQKKITNTKHKQKKITYVKNKHNTTQNINEIKNETKTQTQTQNINKKNHIREK